MQLHAQAATATAMGRMGRMGPPEAVQMLQHVGLQDQLKAYRADVKAARRVRDVDTPCKVQGEGRAWRALRRLFQVQRLAVSRLEPQQLCLERSDKKADVVRIVKPGTIRCTGTFT